MNKILLNLALIHLNNFCQQNRGVDCGTAGTRVVKSGRGFVYGLIASDTGRTIATVRFHKNQVPTFTL